MEAKNKPKSYTYKKVEGIPYILSEHSVTKVETDSKKKYKNYTNN